MASTNDVRALASNLLANYYSTPSCLARYGHLASFLVQSARALEICSLPNPEIAPTRHFHAQISIEVAWHFSEQCLRSSPQSCTLSPRLPAHIMEKCSWLQRLVPGSSFPLILAPRLASSRLEFYDARQPLIRTHHAHCPRNVHVNFS